MRSWLGSKCVRSARSAICALFAIDDRVSAPQDQPKDALTMKPSAFTHFRIAVVVLPPPLRVALYSMTPRSMCAGRGGSSEPIAISQYVRPDQKHAGTAFRHVGRRVITAEHVVIK